MNLVEIVVKVRDDTVAIGKITAVQKAFAGLGIAAAGALGVGVATPLVAATLAIGAFGAIALPTLDKVHKALTTSGTAGQKAWAALSPAQADVARDVQGLQHQFHNLQTSMAPVVARVADLAVRVGSALMPALGALGRAGATVITAVLKPMLALFQSDFFASFIKSASAVATKVGPALGNALASILKSLMQLIQQAGPAGAALLKSLLPAITGIISGFVPFVAGVTRVVAAIVTWLDKSHLLIPVLIAVGVAMAAAWAMGTGGISLIITAIALVVGGITHLWKTSQTFRDIMTAVFTGVAEVVLRNISGIVGIIRILGNVLFDFFHSIVHVMRKVADALGLHFLDGIDNGLGHAQDAFNNFFARVNMRIKDWQTWIANRPLVVRLNGEISDLQNKIAKGLQILKDKHLTATYRSRIEANIDQAQAALAKIRAQLAALQNTVTTTYVQTIGSMPGTVGHRMASGGISGAASGGPRSRFTTVGEHGRELLELPPGTNVRSNPDTERIMAGGRFGHGVALRIEWVGRPLGKLEQAIWECMQNNVRISGGDVQAAMGNI